MSRGSNFTRRTSLNKLGTDVTLYGLQMTYRIEEIPLGLIETQVLGRQSGVDAGLYARDGDACVWRGLRG
jgi:hypothetical protein